MSEHLRSAEDVTREALGNIAGPMRRIFGDGEMLDTLDVLVDQEIEAATDLIRAYAAEVRDAARAEALAGFVEETRVATPSRIGYDANGHGWAYPATHERRLVGPWEPTP